MCRNNTGRNIKNAYKRLMILSKSLPETNREDTLNKIRTAFRDKKGENDPKIVEELLAQAESKIGYLKIVTPKRGSDSKENKFVYINGKAVPGSMAVTNNVVKIPDYESQMRRHHQLMRRQHFLDRK